MSQEEISSRGTMWSLRAIAIVLMVGPLVELSHSEEEKQTSAMSDTSGKCCSGVNYEIDPKTSLECCETLLYDTSTQICCNGSIHDSKPNFQCCGTEYFDPNDGLCCPAYYLGTNKSVSFPPEIANDDEAKKNSRCCGIKLYDSRNQLCCEKRRDVKLIRRYPSIHSSIRGVWFDNNQLTIEQFLELIDHRDLLPHLYFRSVRYTPVYRIRDKKSPNSVCCNGDIAEGDAASTCKNRAVPALFFNRKTTLRDYQNHYGEITNSTILGFCYKTRLNFLTQLCCVVVDNDRAKISSKVHDKTTLTLGCCGLEAYDYDTQICCGGKIRAQNAEGTLGCCGNDVYDESVEDCSVKPPPLDDRYVGLPRNENCTAREPGEYCCGDRAYNLTDVTTLCCRRVDTKTFEKSTLLHTNVENVKKFQCCGLSLYDPLNETCCGATLHPITNPRLCCGDAVYDPRTQICCNGTTFDNDSGQYSCCGFTTYNREKEFCCNDRVFKTEENRSNCCGGRRLYDETNQICCNNDVKDFSNDLAKTKRCC